MTHAECKSKRVKWQALQDEINGCLHWWQLMLEDVMPSEICKRASGAITTYALAPILWDWEMYERTAATNLFANKAMKTHADHNNENKQARRASSATNSILTALRFQSFWRTDTTEKNLFLFFYAVVSELVGGTRGSKKEERRKGVRCRKEADSSPFRK